MSLIMVLVLYQTSIQLAPNSSFFWRNKAKLVQEIQKNAGRWIANAISSFSSQSDQTENTIHWFGSILTDVIGRPYKVAL